MRIDYQVDAREVLKDCLEIEFRPREHVLVLTAGGYKILAVEESTEISRSN
jgi:hypothetical protein